MKTNRDHLHHLLRTEGVVLRREHPDLASAATWLVRQGELCAVLPGVYCLPHQIDDWPVRLRALTRWAPDAVLVGEAAARFSFWPTLRTPLIECALAHERAAQPGFVFSRRRIPPDLVAEQDGIRFSVPALTALDLCRTHGGDGIDRVLRLRAATLEQLQVAMDLTGSRRGNGDRRALLLDSRDEPWSAAERRFHQILRDAGIRGWKANRPVVLDGRLFYLDVAFRRLRLAIEIDGRLHEDDLDVFENDRARQNLLVLNGWTVLRFTWRMLVDHPERVVAEVLEAIDRAEMSARI